MISSTIKATANDQVIFTSLKPMESLSLGEPVLLYDRFMQPDVGIRFGGDHIIVGGGAVDASLFVGWKEIPKFVPEWM